MYTAPAATRNVPPKHVKFFYQLDYNKAISLGNIQDYMSLQFIKVLVFSSKLSSRAPCHSGS